MIIHCNFSKMKNKILPICLQGNYGEFSNTSHGVVGAERILNIYNNVEGRLE